MPRYKVSLIVDKETKLVVGVTAKSAAHLFNQLKTRYNLDLDMFNRIIIEKLIQNKNA